jgi:hypothetical protein
MKGSVNVSARPVKPKRKTRQAEPAGLRSVHCERLNEPNLGVHQTGSSQRLVRC